VAEVERPLSFAVTFRVAEVERPLSFAVTFRVAEVECPPARLFRGPAQEASYLVGLLLFDFGVGNVLDPGVPDPFI